ncbi:beta-lactamase family protein [Acidobacteria bacterium AB60]|nr:beta-lactamase family protein [Acidobacteria bacterium AB60]
MGAMLPGTGTSRRVLSRRLLFFAALGCLIQAPLALGQAGTLAGDYTAKLNELRLQLHLKVEGSGKLSGTLDSLDQGAMGLECADFVHLGEGLMFAVPSVHGTWKGTVSPDGKTLTGTWNQGAPMPLTFTRDTFVPASKPSAVDGLWLGKLGTGNATLRVQLHVRSNQAGEEFCTGDSLDQHAMAMECANVKFAGDKFSFDIPVVHGHWEGTLGADGNSLTGTWNQGTAMALNFTRETSALSPDPPPAAVFDAALKPAGPGNIAEIIRTDLADALATGELAPATGSGLAIGVVVNGQRRVFSIGAAKDDSIFEIGSITKTFTAIILAQMVEQGKVRLDQPVRELLPVGTVAKPQGAEITLVDLATQHSGLPRMPDNFKPADGGNPYVDYHAAQMYAFLAEKGVGKPETPGYLYSNFGFGLLGEALAVRAGVPYEKLLRDEILDPLGMHDTAITLSGSQQARFLPGHTGTHGPAHAWDLDAFAGAGGIRSTAGDMLTYVEANLRPEALKPAGKTGDAATLPKALADSHELRADAFGGQRIALAWHYDPATGNYWHNGATGGYSSYAFFNPKENYGGVVLLNTTVGKEGSFADRVGQHLAQRLAGTPAISLAK